ncbi:Wzz/FepE/Etk N-terminal domain-containing protein [Spirosoma sp. RP8]|uniref:Wzz/FepE/Etk N-terminal domain-containing protein n=1 Tax=Spirosoma liriopis TaxID=2937440 RepID=A0ABT0HJY8_9BACT|nr:Wzz/FepE/Etk N-terminal domain-containing protein [Spirosoma liriopis]MCK8492295.1 Wzz/FepE/Etk N-terminal domain-containing protein [Spirosoma liriopis]
MSTTENRREVSFEDDRIEIRLSDILKFLRASRRWILWGASIGFVIGTLYAFSKPNIYTSQVTVMPEIQAKGAANLGGLGSLAGLAGIDIGSAQGSGMDAIRPDIYPDVLKSIPFALHILDQKVYSDFLRRDTSLRTLFEEQDKKSLITKLLSSKNSQEENSSTVHKKGLKALQLTKRQEADVKAVHNAVSSVYDKKTGIITVSAKLSDPIAAADVARLSLEYLTNYITSYRTEKARNQVQFLTRQVNEARRRYQETELALSIYKDRNRGVFLNTAKIEEQRLQGDFLLAQSVYNDLSKQLEQAKIKVSEESPIFKTLEPASIPLRKSGPNRAAILLGFIIVGAISGSVIYGIRLLKLHLK